MKTLVLCVLAATCLSAISANAEDRFRASGAPLVIANGSNKPIRINPGEATPLDHLHTFECKSPNGCLVLATSNGYVPGSGRIVTVCPQIDGQSDTLMPACAEISEGPFHSRNVASIPQGKHTLQTVAESSTGAINSYFEIDYEIYERSAVSE